VGPRPARTALERAHAQSRTPPATPGPLGRRLTATHKRAGRIALAALMSPSLAVPTQARARHPVRRGAIHRLVDLRRAQRRGWRRARPPRVLTHRLFLFTPVAALAFGLGSRPSHSPQLARHVPDPGAGRGPWRSPACARAVRGVPGLYGTCTERRSAVLGTGHPGGSPAGRQSRNPHACTWVRHTPSVRTGPVSCRPCCGARQADQDATQRSVRRIQVCGPFTSARVGRGSTPAHA
jgi:hypothetical protein